MGHKKHMNCSCAPKEDAPKVLGHCFILKWAVAATERRTPWSGVFFQNGGNKKYVGIQKWGVKQQLNHLIN